MSGLLHRLAAMAAGSAPLVRSDARLPYRAGLDWHTAADSATAPEAAMIGLASALGSPLQRRDRSDLTHSLHPFTRDAQHSEDPPPRNARATGVVDEELLRDEPPARRIRVEAPRASQAGATADALVPAAAHVHEQTKEMHARLPPQARDAMIAPARTAAANTGTSETAPLLPSLSMRSVAIPSTPAPRASDARSHRIVYASASDSPEVHVHIGSIEVTAVHDAPQAQQPRRPSSSAPMSLDSYLAARHRGGA